MCYYFATLLHRRTSSFTRAPLIHMDFSICTCRLSAERNWNVVFALANLCTHCILYSFHQNYCGFGSVPRICVTADNNNMCSSISNPRQVVAITQVASPLYLLFVVIIAHSSCTRRWIVSVFLSTDDYYLNAAMTDRISKKSAAEFIAEWEASARVSERARGGTCDVTILHRFVECDCNVELQRVVNAPNSKLRATRCELYTFI